MDPKDNGKQPAYAVAGTSVPAGGVEICPPAPGLTKREAFAMAAMQGIAADYGAMTGRLQERPISLVAELSVKMADALLVELAKPTPREAGHAE